MKDNSTTRMIDWLVKQALDTLDAFYKQRDEYKEEVTRAIAKIQDRASKLLELLEQEQ